jgi:hypothetical protein
VRFNKRELYNLQVWFSEQKSDNPALEEHINGVCDALEALRKNFVHSCQACDDCQPMRNIVSGEEFYRCYGMHPSGVTEGGNRYNSFPMKTDICKGAELPDKAPDWCPKYLWKE